MTDDDDDDDFPKLGRDFQHWSELDHLLPDRDLDLELSLSNVGYASFVILSVLIKQKDKREKLIRVITPEYFDEKLMERYLFTKIAECVRNGRDFSEADLEAWIPEYSKNVWNEDPPGERMFFGDNMNLRIILKLDPTEEQLAKAIELRKEMAEEEKNRKE